ncbi:MAG: hypothetical protein NZM44_00485, partial [Candidatus Calescibacterium sp.]|nr:hypothetical protein [Candidatus Calescibacterium sp.]
MRVFMNFEIAQNNKIIEFTRDFVLNRDGMRVRVDEADTNIGALMFNAQDSNEFKKKIIQYLKHLKEDIVIHDVKKKLGFHVIVPRDRYNIIVETFRPILLPYTPKSRKNIVLKEPFINHSDGAKRIRIFSTYMIILFPEMLDIIKTLVESDPPNQTKATIIIERARNFLYLYLKKTKLFDEIFSKDIYIVSKSELEKIWANRNKTIINQFKKEIEMLNKINYIGSKSSYILIKIIQNFIKNNKNINHILKVIKLFTSLIQKLESKLEEVSSAKTIKNIRGIFNKYEEQAKSISLRDINRIARRIIKERMKAIEEELIFGGDPEFATIRDNRWVPAGRWIANGLSSPIGVDIDSRILEIRPRPAKTAYKLLKNFYKIIKNYKVKESTGSEVNIFEVFDLIASYDEDLALGGHIHIGSNNKNMIDFLHDKGVEIVDEINSLIFDSMYKLSTPCRQNGSFMNSAIEGKSYGFEYRTPPAAVWVNPKLFSMLIKLIKVIITKKYIN